jgi:hypothetical protein
VLEGAYFFHLADEPTSRVEIVDRHVHEDASQPLRQPVVVRRGSVAVRDPKQLNAPDAPRVDVVLRGDEVGVEPPLEADLQADARTPGGIDGALRPIRLDRQRLLAEDVHVRGGGALDQLRVQRSRSGDDDPIDLATRERIVRVGRPARAELGADGRGQVGQPVDDHHETGARHVARERPRVLTADRSESDHSHADHDDECWPRRPPGASADRLTQGMILSARGDERVTVGRA